MYTNKIEAGAIFPALIVKDLNDNEVNITNTKDNFDWQMIVVYRGKHCPLCTKYLNQLTDYIEKLNTISVGVVAVSADSKAQLTEHLNKLNINFSIHYGLDIAQMQSLGLYISNPRSEKETDHAFAEPALFVINEQGQVQVVDISNNPFVRPELEALVSGLSWIRNPDNNYPIRGTYK